MNVLMVNANRCTQPMPVIPLGACLVAEAAAAAGHRVHFLDLMAHDDLLGALRRELALHNPDVVGFSLRNIDNNEIANPVTYFSELIPLVEAVRDSSQATVVVGGAALAVMPEALLRKIGADLRTGAGIASTTDPWLDEPRRVLLHRLLPTRPWVRCSVRYL